MSCVKWIPRAQALVGPSAVPWYGAGTMPQNLRPAFLKDRGGAGGHNQLVGSDSVGAAPYELENWSYTFYSGIGQVLATVGPEIHTHQAGMARLLALWQGPWTGSGGKIVCGAYSPAHYVKTPVTYCTYDGITTKIGNPSFTPLHTTPTKTTVKSYFKVPTVLVAVTPPPPAPGPTLYRGGTYAPIYPKPPSVGPLRGVQWLGAVQVPAACWQAPGFNKCHDDALKNAQSLCYGMSESTIKQMWGGNVENCVNTNFGLKLNSCIEAFGCAKPPLEPLPETAKGSNYPWGEKSTYTTALQNEINEWLKSKGHCPIGADGKLGPVTCGAAEYYRDNSGYGGASGIPGGVPSSCKSAPTFVPKNPPCPGAGTAPPPKQCSEAPCSPTEDCVAGDCLPKCPAGEQRDPQGNCIKPSAPATAAGEGAGAGLGWLLGIGAAAAALFIGMRAPALPEQPARARLARKRPRPRTRPRRRRAA